jgi:hypothetical protein
MASPAVFALGLLASAPESIIDASMIESHSASGSIVNTPRETELLMSRVALGPELGVLYSAREQELEWFPVPARNRHS